MDYTFNTKPLYSMAKPIGSKCNLACTYCYYKEKGFLFGENAKEVMDDSTLEIYIKQYIEMQPAGSPVLFTWHGGEPLLRPMSFYRKALEYERKYANGHPVDNSLQTNGTLITEDWARFFKDNQFLLGVSIDGPEDIHDKYRLSITGRPSWKQVMQGIELLDRVGVEWNALAVVGQHNVTRPLDFYHFFKEIGCRYIQFTPLVERFLDHLDGRYLASPIERTEKGMAPFSVDPDGWGNFLCTIFDEWVKNDVGEYFIQMFDSTLARWMGLPPSVCTLAETCGHASIVEWNGDVFVCDHYAFPEFRLGNIHERHLYEMMTSPAVKAFGNNKRDKLTKRCRECDFLFACNGECPRNRFVSSELGDFGNNYLCRGYKRFFAHVSPYMDYMKKCLMQGRPASDVMTAYV